MTIALRGTPTGANDYAGTTVTINYPTGHTTNDERVLAVSHAYSGTVGNTDPTGWTALTNDVRTNGIYSVRQKTYWRVDDGSLGSSLTITHVAGGGAHALMYAFSGASTSAPDAAQYGSANASSATCDFPALGTWASNNGYDLALAAFYSPSNYPTSGDPSGYTSGPSTADVVWGSAHGSHKAVTGVTTVGALTAVWSGTNMNVGGHIFIKEPAEAGGGTLFLMLEDNSGSYELEDGSGGTLLES